MKRVCPACGATIAATDINNQYNTSKCSRCGEVFDVSQTTGAGALPWKSTPPITAPRGFTVSHYGADLVIKHAWFTPNILLLLLFGCVWDIVLSVAIYAIWFDTSSIKHYYVNNGPILVSIIIFIFSIIGLSITYVAICQIVNHTTIRVNDSIVEISYGPLPVTFAKPIVISVHEIARVFCNELNRTIGHSYNNSIIYTNYIVYQIQACLNSGKCIVIDAFTESNSAAFLKQQIENRLGIVDKQVAGESRYRKQTRYLGIQDLAMQLVCPTCGSAIAATDINIQQAVAKCARCSEVFSFSTNAGEVAPTQAVKTIGDPLLEAPWCITVTQSGADLVITRLWLEWYIIIWAVTPLFWFSILPGNLYVLPDIILAYILLARLVNRTTITVNDQSIEVRHGPLPWLGNKSIPSRDINQLYCGHHQNNSFSNSYSGFDVQVCLTNGERIILLSRLRRYSHARFIEQQIENRLGIVDRPVAGEIKWRT